MSDIYIICINCIMSTDCIRPHGDYNEQVVLCDHEVATEITVVVVVVVVEITFM